MSQCEVPTSGNPTFDHVLQKDAFLLLRALCRLSIKPTGEGTDAKLVLSFESIANDFFFYRMALSARTLCLQMILSILQNAGRAFRAQVLYY